MSDAKMLSLDLQASLGQVFRRTVENVFEYEINCEFNYHKLICQAVNFH
jgi:DNA-binding XRE family transcriptional regulator